MLIGFPWRHDSLKEPGRELELGQEVARLPIYLFSMKKDKQEQNMKELLHAENVRWDEEIEAGEASGVKPESIQFNRPPILAIKFGSTKINFKYTCKFIK